MVLLIQTLSALVLGEQLFRQAPTMSKSIKFEVLNVGSSPLEESFKPKPTALVFRHKQAWTKFWASSSFLDMNLQKRPAPELNFDKQMVIALTPGSRPNGGFSVRIERIEQVLNPQGNQWVIHYTEIIPEPNCLVTQQPITPSVFILTQKSDAAIELKGQKITSPCSS